MKRGTIEGIAHSAPDAGLDSNTRKVAAVCAIVGSSLLLFGTYLHPVPAEPNDAAQAFAAYAADRLWVTSHLMQLIGTILALAVLIILVEQFETSRTTVWSRLASAGAITSIALAAALQAVDGIALRAMVQNWAAAAGAQKASAFQSAFAVRQLEIGLARPKFQQLTAISAHFDWRIKHDGTASLATFDS
jgi:hypothetical protein